MKARLVLIAAAGVLLGGLALAAPAEAGHLDWSFGAGFHVGGLHFNIGFSPVGYAGYGGPFFYTTSRLHYPGHVCTGACFRRGAAFYHHPACPVLGVHLRGFGYGPNHFILNYSPYRYRGYAPGYRGYPNRSYGYYQRDGWRERYRSDRGRHYRDRHYRDHRHRDRHLRDRHRRDHRADRHRGRDYRRDDGDRDRGRHYRDERRDRRRDGNRDRDGRRRGARHTRPPG